ncbi:MAG: SynChlorMet cassette radical SAM/SPASM protein ScmF [Syntrophales bacterium]|jgi:SynChlorMet cassette radical SAM/SPASM protein ScmF|nr:SynChlorMet cassette radical SAM/SPASM protein ScmF [Syntrophales bacterium]MDD4340249.1 SynChlorMet cassette radical SAM/SPASM protein ScmF [Syntrophales bacterium]
MSAENKNKHDLIEVKDYPLNQIYFYLTGGCNLNCRHCWIEPRKAQAGKPFPALDPEMFQGIINEAIPMGLKGVKLTGGEPLLHPQIGVMIDIVRKNRLNLSMETNGTLCTKDIAAKMAECRNLSVSVSLDGADATTHEWVRGRKGCFQETLEGIGHLVRAGIRPQIIMTVMRCNRDQMADLVRLAETLNAASVKFNVLQPTARGLKMHEASEGLDVGELISTGTWVDEELSATTKLDLYFHQPPAFRSLGRMFGKGGDGCYSCGILGILGVLSDGSYALCGIGTTVPELIFGRAGQDPLEKVWRDNSTLNEIRQGLPERLTGVCASCVMKQICSGSCLAQNYYRSGNLWAPFWYCEEARSQGLFPESRLLPNGLSQPAKEVKNDGAKNPL